nr:EutN/CcmL family microcompartment protein [Luteitalea sp. TBR-22]
MPASSASSTPPTWSPDVQIGTVVGTVVSTQKHAKLHGAKLLLVQPELPDGTAKGNAVLAVDSVGAGVGERVLLVIEGKAAGDALGRKAAPVDAAIIGIVDALETNGAW